MEILILHWIFSPCVDIFASHGVFSSHVSILTWHGYFHLTWVFSPCVDISPHMDISTSNARSLYKVWWSVPSAISKVTSHGAFSLHIGIFTSCGDIQLAWTFSPSVGILTLHGAFSPHVPGAFLPHMGFFTLCGHSHLTYILTCSPQCKNNIFHLTWNLNSPQKIMKQPQFHQ